MARSEICANTESEYSRWVQLPVSPPEASVWMLCHSFFHALKAVNELK